VEDLAEQGSHLSIKLCLLCLSLALELGQNGGNLSLEVGVTVIYFCWKIMLMS